MSTFEIQQSDFYVPRRPATAPKVLVDGVETKWITRVELVLDAEEGSYVLIEKFFAKEEDGKPKYHTPYGMTTEDWKALKADGWEVGVPADGVLKISKKLYFSSLQIQGVTL